MWHDSACESSKSGQSCFPSQTCHFIQCSHLDPRSPFPRQLSGNNMIRHVRVSRRHASNLTAPDLQRLQQARELSWPWQRQVFQIISALCPQHNVLQCGGGTAERPGDKHCSPSKVACSALSALARVHSPVLPCIVQYTGKTVRTYNSLLPSLLLFDMGACRATEEPGQLASKH